MLADSTLAELTKSAPSREALVRLAWPALDVASKLRVIEVIQGFRGVLTSTPDWLHDLAMSNEAGIVRYWSARAFSFDDGPVTEPNPQQLVFSRTTQEDVERTERARTDPEPLVRAATNRRSLLASFAGVERMTQLERLQLIREGSDPFMRSFFEWLGKCVDEGLVPDAELTECLSEYYESEPFTGTQARIDGEWDGYYAFSAGEALDTAWALVPRAGPMLSARLVQRLPFRYRDGMGGPTDELLDALPEELQEWMLYRHDEPMAAAFIERVRTNPERYGEKLVDQVRRRDAEPWDYAGPRNGEEIDRKHKHLTESLEHAHERLEKLQEGMQELFEMVRDASSRKRGIFG
jgi:hypothetical protein